MKNVSLRTCTGMFGACLDSSMVERSGEIREVLVRFQLGAWRRMLWFCRSTRRKPGTSADRTTGYNLQVSGSNPDRSIHGAVAQSGRAGCPHALVVAAIPSGRRSSARRAPVLHTGGCGCDSRPVHGRMLAGSTPSANDLVAPYPFVAMFRERRWPQPTVGEINTLSRLRFALKARLDERPVTNRETAGSTPTGSARRMPR